MVTKEKVKRHECLVRRRGFVIEFLRLVVRISEIIGPDLRVIVVVLRINFLSTDVQIEG
jgi:hypothetical protein